MNCKNSSEKNIHIERQNDEKKCRKYVREDTMKKSNGCVIRIPEEVKIVEQR